MTHTFSLHCADVSFSVRLCSTIAITWRNNQGATVRVAHAERRQQRPPPRPPQFCALLGNLLKAWPGEVEAWFAAIVRPANTRQNHSN